MTTAEVTREPQDWTDAARSRRARITLAAATIGFFMITLDAVIVNVALPSMRADLGGGVAGLQWVVDGYTLMFAGLLLSSGVITDRLGAKRAFGVGMALFAVSSTACAIAPNLSLLIAARFVQGAAAAVMMPSSMSLISQAYPDRSVRARAVGVWAMGGAIASSCGPLLGGLLTLSTWRLIFAINIPVGIVTLWLVARIGRSPVRDTPFDWRGLFLVVTAMGSLTFGVIEAGAVGLTDGRVVAAFAVALATSVAFIASQRRSATPMVPPDLVRNREVQIASIVGFAFIVGYYGLPFVMSLFLQEERGLTSFETGLVFLPMMVVGAILVPFSARAAELVGGRRLVGGGLVLMTIGLAGTAVSPPTAPIWVLSTLMALVGLAGPAVMPPTMAMLLSNVPDEQAGTASGIFNTSRQLGGALAIAVFGALLAGDSFHDGLEASMFLAAAVTLLAAAANGFVGRRTGHATDERHDEYAYRRS